MFYLADEDTGIMMTNWFWQNSCSFEKFPDMYQVLLKQLIVQKFSLLLVWQKVTGLTTLATARILIIFTYVIEGLDFLLSELHDVQHQFVLDKKTQFNSNVSHLLPCRVLTLATRDTLLAPLFKRLVLYFVTKLLELDKKFKNRVSSTLNKLHIDIKKLFFNAF